MKTNVTRSSILVAISLLVISFQCDKPYKDNHVIQIEGQFVDIDLVPVPYFEFYVSHRGASIGPSEERRSSEKIVKTDASGKFKIITPQIQEAYSRMPALVFVDTTWTYDINVPPSLSESWPFVPFSTNGNTNSSIDLGTLIIHP